MEVFLDMLRAMRLTGGLFLDAEFSAPWCVSAKVGPEDCTPFALSPRHIIAYHYVVSGRCFLRVGEREPVALEAGQIVLLARNDEHVIGSDLTRRAISADGLIRPGLDGGPARIVHGGGGEETRILCGFLASDLAHNALVAMLPPVLTLDVVDGVAGSWIESSFRFAATQLMAGRASGSATLAKLAELLFVEAVDRYAASRPAGRSIWMEAMRDPAVGRALALIHGELAHHWTTEELASAAALSRSAFAERFKRAVGEPPMHYVVRQRLESATTRLRESGDPVARIAFEAGYESEAAFNRAFRRHYGMPPAAWRRRERTEAKPIA